MKVLVHSGKVLNGAFALLMASHACLGGPPFKTDDPQPVDFGHWEAYIASEQQFDRSESDATLPHFELNYGLMPNTQVHLVAPLEYVRTADGVRYGYSSTEVGIKFRFLEESDGTPQIGVFPLAEIPTDDKRLADSRLQLYLPLWLQKSWGRLTTYGGGGLWYTPAEKKKNWEFLGWQVQFDFSDVLTLGGELYYNTPDESGMLSDAGCGIGGFINVDEHDHLLFSIGHNMLRTGSVSGYLGYQLTL
jgi:hypothetical protein